MIRKPTEQDFREGAAVTVLRETKRTAVEAGNGAGRGMQGVARLWLYGVLWFGVLTTAIPAMLTGHLWQGLVFLGVCFGIQQALRKGFKAFLPFLSGRRPSSPKPAASTEPSAAADPMGPWSIRPGHRRSRQSGTYGLALPIAVRQALSLAIPGAVLLLLSLGLWVITLIPGLACLLTAMLILRKMVVDRTLVQFDHRTITVSNLLGKATIDWAQVEDVTARTFSHLNLKVLVSIGTRRAIVLAFKGEHNERREARIPIDLLDLDEDGLAALVSDLICCRAAGGEIVPAWQPQPEKTYVPTPTADPRESFDRDAILAHYKAEADRTLAGARRSDTTKPQLPKSQAMAQ